jgi:hypothetical protein
MEGTIVSERENYRETLVGDLLLKTWSEGNRLMTVISWPPHGIVRPIGITLTLSQAEVDTLAACWRGEASPEAEATAINISHAVMAQCALLRAMQQTPGVTFDLPTPSEVKP